MRGPTRGASGMRLSSAGEPSSDALEAGSGPSLVNCTIVDNTTEGWSEPYSYDVDCWDARPTIMNTIIYGSDTSLLIADLSGVSHCCIRETHLFQRDYQNSSAVVDPLRMLNTFGGIARLRQAASRPSHVGESHCGIPIGCGFPLRQCRHSRRPGIRAVRHRGAGQAHGSRDRYRSGRSEAGADRHEPCARRRLDGGKRPRCPLEWSRSMRGRSICSSAPMAAGTDLSSRRRCPIPGATCGNCRRPLTPIPASSTSCRMSRMPTCCRSTAACSPFIPIRRGPPSHRNGLRWAAIPSGPA